MFNGVIYIQSYDIQLKASNLENEGYGDRNS